MHHGVLSGFGGPGDPLQNVMNAQDWAYEYYCNGQEPPFLVSLALGPLSPHWIAVMTEYENARERCEDSREALRTSFNEGAITVRQYATHMANKEWELFMGSIGIPDLCRRPHAAPGESLLELDDDDRPAEYSICEDAPISAAAVVLELLDGLQIEIDSWADKFFDESVGTTAHIADEALRMATSRKDPIRFGLGEGWSLELPYLELPDLANGRAGAVYFDSYRHRPFTNASAAAFVHEQAVLFDLWQDAVEATPDPCGRPDAKDATVAPGCLVELFGADHPFLRLGPPEILSIDQVFALAARRPEIA